MHTDNKDRPKFLREAELQGWTVRKTKKGFRLLAPDRSTSYAIHTLHRSSSPHALRDTVRKMSSQASFRWPPEKGEV